MKSMSVEGKKIKGKSGTKTSGFIFSVPLWEQSGARGGQEHGWRMQRTTVGLCRVRAESSRKSTEGEHLH